MDGLLRHYREMARYNRWMNERLYALADELGDEARKRELGAFFGSLHGTFNHLLLTDRVWLSRLGIGSSPAFRALSDELYADFAELRAARAETDAALVAYLEALAPAALDGTIEYGASSGRKRHALWMALSQLFNHQTHHRGQATTLFMQLGRDPGVTDLIPLLRGDIR